MYLKLAITNLVLFLLLIFGPKFRGIENGLLYHLLILISLPLVTLFIVHWLLKKYQVDRKTEIGMEGILSGIVGICIMIYAILETIRITKSSGYQDWTLLPLIWMGALIFVFLAFGKKRQFNKFNKPTTRN